MEFYRFGGLLATGIFIVILILLSLVLVFTLTETYSNLWFCLGFLILCLLVFIAYRKVIFSRILINEKEIKIYYGNQVYKSISWNDVIKVERTVDFNSQNLTLYGKKEETLDFNITIKKARKIAEICPKEDIKEQIENIKFPFDFSKKKNKN